ncbi:MAG: hypothetical protein IT379_13345 [Deltaproteobacteria bacterium]|nr:hypothetical protein [Deltaproteobacteria bacterium]
MDLKIEAANEAVGRTVERTLVVRDPDGEEAAWPDAERVVAILVRARDGSLVRDDEGAGTEDMLGGGCTTTGGHEPEASWLAPMTVAIAVALRRRRRRR